MAPMAFTVAGPLFTIARSAIGFTVVVTVALVLFGRFGSVVPGGAVTVALLASDPLAGAVPVIVMTTLPFLGNVVTVPVTLLPATLTAPHTALPSAPPQLAATPVIAAGIASANVAPSAELGPAL